MEFIKGCFPQCYNPTIICNLQNFTNYNHNNKIIFGTQSTRALYVIFQSYLINKLQLIYKNALRITVKTLILENQLYGSYDNCCRKCYSQHIRIQQIIIEYKKKD